jgi:molybdopterin/thiamine biosynthesis adenylyltransferase
MTNEELKRYDRHIILPEIGIEGQQKLMQASVLVIGAGGLGCPLLQYLVAAGVGTIGIVDDDTIDESNLQRQILYNIHDIGKAKVSVAIEKLSAQNPFCKFNSHQQRLAADNALEIIANYDIVVDGSDNFPTRYLVNDACVMLDKTLVFGSVFKFEGQVAVFNYNGSATYRCLYPDPPASEDVPNCSDIGVLGVLPGLTGLMQATEVINIITGLGEVLSNR